MKTVKVFGHKAPDTDATCSAVSFAWYLKNAKKMDSEAFVLGSLNKETKFVLDKFGITHPKELRNVSDGERVAIVDTNNPDELLDVEKSEIVELLDHHKLVGGLSSDYPFTVLIKPLASTCSLVYEKVKEAKLEITKEMAGIMLSGILSDTLKFTSPTTTDLDKKYAEELSEICGEDIDKLAGSMFEAKSDLSGMDAKDILLGDSKVYDTNGKKVRYSVLETTKPENALNMKKDLLDSMNALKKDEGIDYLFFFAVDILNSEAHLLVTESSEKEIAEKSFGVKFNGDVALLPGVVSRKKQIIPSIEPNIK